MRFKSHSIKQYLLIILIGTFLFILTSCYKTTSTSTLSYTKCATTAFTHTITKTTLPTYTKPYVPPIPLQTPHFPEGSPAQIHGKLHVIGSNLMDASNTPYQLIGISSHGLQWFPQFINVSSFKTLKEDWGANVIRLAFYSEDYAMQDHTGREALLNTLEDGIRAATELGLYVIIDWHILTDGDPNTYIEEAKEFFDYFATKYANYSNILFEICNEPNGSTVSWDYVIKPYADEILPIIRKSSSDSIVIVGTPIWCQSILSVNQNRINDANVMYALHFYAASHTAPLRDTLKTAYEDKGIPIFVSEFGTCDASGSGTISEVESDAWLTLLNTYNISWVNWSLCDKEEASALLYPGASPEGNWSDDVLTVSGKYIKAKLKERATQKS